MYSTSSGQRRGLLRSHSSHSGPVFRNLPLFGFLAGLVLFFYIFYIYEAQNAELSLAKEQSDFKSLEARKLNDEITDLKVQLEKQKSDSESALESAKKEQFSAEEKFRNCSTVQMAQQANIIKLENEKRDYAEKLQTVKAQLEQLNDTLSAMRVVNKNNEETIVRLNGTIIELQDRIRKAQLAANPSSLDIKSVVPNVTNVNPPNQDLIQQRLLEAKSLIKSSIVSVKNEEQENKNVAAIPAIAANNDEVQAVKTNDNGEVKKGLVDVGDEGRAYDDGDDVRILLKKDYRNSAEEDNLRIQENKMKPKEDGLGPENDEKKN